MPGSEKHDNRKRQVRRLRELIAALDRRVPHIERVGEIRIARDAAILRDKAMKRLVALEAAMTTASGRV